MNAVQYWRYQAALQMAHLGGITARRWKPFTRLLIIRDYAGWALDEEAKALQQCCRKLGMRLASGIRAPHVDQQVTFYSDQFALLKPESWRNHRLAFAYFHGHPGTGVREFDDVFHSFCQHQDRISRVQVSHSQMRDVLLSTGVESDKVRLIPIAADVKHFRPATDKDRLRKRRQLGLPESAFVVGSFQKDGVGWGEGIEPKLIKGPDVFVDVLRRLKDEIPELHVLLSGPSRGYVKQRLTEVNIPWKHVYLKNFRDLPGLYHALDAYLVSSRQEGGPKAVFESMASKVPLVTTRVGQAMDIVRNGENGLICDIEDCEGLADKLLHVYEMPEAERSAMVDCGRKTAEANSWAEQGSLWQSFFDGVVES